MGDALGHSPRVDENEGCAVGAYLGGDAVENLPELFGRRHGFELAGGKLDREVEVALMTRVEDRARQIFAARAGSDEQPSDATDRPLSGRQPNALRAPGADMLEPLERESEVRPPLVARDRVDLVDDDGVHGFEHGPASL